MTNILKIRKESIPFREQPLSRWKYHDDLGNHDDLGSFLYALFDSEMIFHSESGEILTARGGDNGSYVFNRNLETIGKFADDFSERLRGERVNYDFRECPVFGGFAKAFAAWDGVLEEVLSESLFFSLFHILESQTDLKATLPLLREHYYRQAFSLLRFFLEDLVKPLYWMNHIENFHAWMKAERVPIILTGKNGMVRSLEKLKVVDSGTREHFERLYRTLSGFVHGGERQLIHGGLARDEWKGHVFDNARLHAFLRIAKESIELAIRLVGIQVDQWALIRKTKGNFCSQCHQTAGITYSEFSFGELRLRRYTCTLRYLTLVNGDIFSF